MYLTTVILIIMIHFQANLQNKLKQAPAIACYYGSPKSIYTFQSSEFGASPRAAVAAERSSPVFSAFAPVD